jgi:2,3-bisphosphoglycerate-independent phosphoglycerate mutase
MKRPTPLVLTILDGWGYRPETKDNAVALARKPNYDKLLSEHPNTLIHTSGRYVGLPTGQMGNSEVGHLNIGAGRVVYMDITRIDLMIENGTLFSQPTLLEAMKNARTGERRLHLFGLLSDGGVHSQQEHLYALLRMAKQNGVERVFVHCLMDGRDTPPDSGAGYVEQLQQKMREYGVGKIATVIGRYYAMDRDKRWERVAKGFRAMVLGDSEVPKCVDPVLCIKDSYNKKVTDEFIMPIVCVDDKGEPVGAIRDEDSVICFNFRADRAREITRALTRNSGVTADGGRELPDSAGLDAEIPRDAAPKNLRYVCMTQYDADFRLPHVVPTEELHNILANILADHKLRNLRVAETEKYPHVTFFFNGGVETPFPGEDRILVPSPKVATYDMQPEMSAPEVTRKVVESIEKNSFDLIVVNFANADMVGHSGKLEPAIHAVEAVDVGLGCIYAALRQRGGAMIVTADHGNAETMVDPITGGPHTYHTTNPVPLIVVGEDSKKFTLRADGALQDISPTVLGMLGLPQPQDMTGKDLRVMKSNK